MIHRLKTDFPDYIGDDAAVFSCTEYNQSYVTTNDLLIEDIHFRTRYFDPADLAHKALHVNLSDIAAMGAKPQFILCGIGIPAIHADYAQDFLSCLASACRHAGVTLIGGDTTGSPDKLFISITAIGIAHSEQIKYRRNAIPDNYLCVAGNLGHAHIGFLASEQSRSSLDEYKQAFFRPNAKILEGAWLASKPSVTSMMDISDGLFITIKHLCESSHVGAIIELEKLAISSAFRTACDTLSLDPITTVLTGGEDYSLLFTVCPNHYPTIADEFKEHFGYHIACIGYITSDLEVSMTKHAHRSELSLTPFTHFGEEV